MPTMLYTRDGQLAIDKDRKPQKGVFDQKKIACFYSVFNDEDVTDAVQKGWQTWQDFIAAKEAPVDVEDSKIESSDSAPKRRGRPPKVKADVNGD